MKNKIQEYLLQLNHPELDQKFISEKNIKLISIEDNKINHRLNFYKIEKGLIKEIF